MPTIVEGMRAMKAGEAPTREALSAIGRALEIAKSDTVAQQQVEGLFAQVAADDGDQSGFFNWTAIPAKSRILTAVMRWRR